MKTTSPATDREGRRYRKSKENGQSKENIPGEKGQRMVPISER